MRAKTDYEILSDFAELLNLPIKDVIRNRTVINPYTLNLICSPPVFKVPEVWLNDYNTQTGEFRGVATIRAFKGEPEPPKLKDRSYIWKRFGYERVTVLDCLNKLPEDIREVALEQCKYLDNDCGSVSDAIASLLENEEEPLYTFWVDVWFHYAHGLDLPKLPLQKI